MESIIGPLFPLSYLTLLGLERLLKTGRQKHVPRWTAKGVTFFAVGLAINVLLPPIVEPAVASLTPLKLSWLGLPAGVLAVVLASSFVDYWIHRAMHRLPWLWRWTHQMHHSAERVDLAGFAYAHPFELVFSVLVATVVGGLLGVERDAVLLGGYVWFLAQLFLHMDIDTPRWIGLVLQRPEGHRVHHTRGVHAYNYGLPLWDAIFGTRRNPASWDREYGFWDGASRRVGQMLMGRDVSTELSSR